MNPQTYIRALIDQLSESKKKDYSKILKNFDFSKVDFCDIENWLPNTYTRNCFYRDDYIELILICWDREQKTAIHDHDGEDCWVYLLEGEMEEDFYRLEENGKLRLTSTKILQTNQLTKSDQFSGFHRLRITSEKRALSLHVYAKPIEQSQTYDEMSGKLIKKKLNYCSYKPIKSLVKTS